MAPEQPPEEPAPGRHDGWPWRDFNRGGMTRGQATAEALYAVQMHAAAMLGRLDDFGAAVADAMAPTAAGYRRRGGDWAV